jgi:poly(hydroxyalkanoate) depolymerase family esterase
MKSFRPEASAAPLAGSRSPRAAERGTVVVDQEGQRIYQLYVPAGYRPGAATPLLVMLHGCKQDPDDFATGTRMNEYADRHTFLVLYPQQPKELNPQQCWNWFLASNQARGRGEPAEIVAIIEQVCGHYTIDRGRIYAAGISAGGAMALILAATYPDVFAAVGVCAAVAYRAATGVSGALRTMRRGGNRQRISGRAVAEAMGDYQRVMPLILFHGTADRTVSPVNAQQIVTQWSELNRLAANGMAHANQVLPSDTTEEMIAGRGVTRRRYDSSDGLTLIESYVIQGMGHSWPGGSSRGSFIDTQGPDASALMVAFFLNHPMVDLNSNLICEPVARVPQPVAAQPPTEERPVAAPPPPPPLRFEPPLPEQQDGRLKRMGGLLRHLWRRIRDK